jgi:hypothetical protein
MEKGLAVAEKPSRPVQNKRLEESLCQHEHVPAPADSRFQSPADVSSLDEQAEEAFLRDLPQLLKERPGQWVVYRGAERLGFGTTKTALLQQCYAQGFREDELLVQKIQSEIPPAYATWREGWR